MFDQPSETKTELTTKTNHSAAQGSEDEDYLYRRAEQELELAQAATHPAVVKAHYRLADAYLDSLYGGAEEAVPA